MSSETVNIFIAIATTLTLLAGLVAWLLKIRAEITAIAGQVEAVKAEVAQLHKRCGDRYEWMKELTNTVKVIDKNQTRLAAMLGVDIQES